jgi:hypothetical protein
MSEINTLRDMRPVPAPAELEAMRMAARERFVARTGPRRARQPWRLPVLASGLTAGATATAAAALVLTSGPGAVPGEHGTAAHTRTVVTAAWTVREAADGTVTIDVRQYADPSALQQTLRADRINAIVRQIPSEPLTFGNGLTIAWPTCNYTPADMAPQAVQRAVWTIEGQILPARFILRPEALPQGSALFLTFLTGMPRAPKNGNTGILALKPLVLNNDTVPACVPRKKLLPTTFPVNGKQLTTSPASNP